MSRLAKVLQGLSLSEEDIAERAKIPAERVRRILSGEAATLADLQALSRGLKVPLRTFARPSEPATDLALMFRSTTQSRRDLGVESVSEFVEAALSILPVRDQPPAWLTALSPNAESYAEAERLANRFRQMFIPEQPDDPLPNLHEILLQLGSLVIGKLENSRFEGASVIANGYAFIFVSPRFSGRMLFTLAHELGHLLAHHDAKRAVVFDRATQIGGSRRSTRPEAFVNAFASLLLLPKRGVGLALRQIRSTLQVKDDQIGDVEILYLARFYGVSFDVAARRCEDLNLLPEGGAVSLADHLRRKHGGAEKRAAALGIPERSQVHIPPVSDNLLMASAEQVMAGNVSVGWVTDRFGCSINDVYAARLALEAQRGPHH